MDTNPRTEDAPSATLCQAGLLRRLAALGYDFLIVAAILFVYTLVGVGVHEASFAPGTVTFHVYRLGLVALAAAYFIGFWVKGGQTLGARAWRMRLVTVDGRGVGGPSAILRLICAAVSQLPALLVLYWLLHTGRADLWWCAAVLVGSSYFWILPDPGRLCLHDRLSGTRLIRER